MVTDRQVRRLRRCIRTERTFAAAASKAGMDEKTARKYLRANRLPSEMKVEHTWRTRKDPFAEVWPDLEEMLNLNPGLEAKTLFDYLQQQYPTRFADGQLRTLQRRLKQWRALEGPPKEAFFAQEHKPGRLCQSDFTHMNDLGITLAGQPFEHSIYHFVLPYSNWETGSICFSESFEALAEGLQNALWELGGVPMVHQSDRLSAAVNNLSHREEFTERYAALLRHYGLGARKINAGQAHENGDIEQRHYRFKRALEQQLMLRGSRNFQNRQEYAEFLKKLFAQLNAGRRQRFAEELKVFRRLPLTRFDTTRVLHVAVNKGSTIRVAHNVYSVHSRLIGEWVKVKVYAEHLEVWYAQRCVEKLPRLRGKSKHHIQYRHIIDCLVRKPGAFANYRYQSDLFPSHRFRMAYDFFKEHNEERASKEYLKILHLAAYEGEARVDQVLEHLFQTRQPLTYEAVKKAVQNDQACKSRTDVCVEPVNLSVYDELLKESGVLP